MKYYYLIAREYSSVDYNKTFVFIQKTKATLFLHSFLDRNTGMLSKIILERVTDEFKYKARANIKALYQYYNN